jgi:hypothetical protein
VVSSPSTIPLSERQTQRPRERVGRLEDRYREGETDSQICGECIEML